MRKELDFFYIGDSYGGNQDWCLDHMMQLAGCGAVTACDCSIYFKLRMGLANACPEEFSAELPMINLRKPLSVIDGIITMPEETEGERMLCAESKCTAGCAVEAAAHPLYQGPGTALDIDQDIYIHFTELMKPYLHPRWSGLDRLCLFTEGLSEYYAAQGIHCIGMEEFPGEHDAKEAMRRVKEQLDLGFPIPCLTLNHRNPAMEDYVWHWFLLVGYETEEQDPWGENFKVKTATYSESNWVKLTDLWDTGYEQKGGLVLFHRKAL